MASRSLRAGSVQIKLLQPSGHSRLGLRLREGAAFLNGAFSSGNALENRQSPNSWNMLTWPGAATSGFLAG